MKRWFPIFFLPLVIGCVPLPYATPPAKVDIGAAYRMGEDENAATFPIRAGLHVMQIFPEYHERRLDVAPGWGVYPTTAGALMHGPFFEAGWLFPRGFNEEGGGWRWGVNAKAHYLLPDGLDSGFAGTLQGTVEWVGITSEPYVGCEIEASSNDPYEPDSSARSSCHIGVAHGEGGIGFFLETSYAKLGNVDVGWAGGGLIFRIPATFGIVLVPIWE